MMPLINCPFDLSVNVLNKHSIVKAVNLIIKEISHISLVHHLTYTFILFY